MNTLKLYRAVSQNEFEDWEKIKAFRTAKNTLEAKQFFKSLLAVKDFVSNSQIQKFSPAYSMILEIEILNDCLNSIQVFTTELDRFEAITVSENDLPGFNKCVQIICYFRLHSGSQI